MFKSANLCKLLVCMHDVQVCKLSNIQKQWRNFSLRDYKFCTRMFVLFKKIDEDVFVNTPSYSDLPRTTPPTKKRKSTGRGGHKKKKSRVDALAQTSSTSEVDSPLKSYVIDLDAFTDDEQDYELRNDVVEEEGDEGEASDDAQMFETGSESGDD